MSFRDTLYLFITLLLVIFLAGFGAVKLLNQNAIAATTAPSSAPSPLVVLAPDTTTTISLEGLWKFQTDPEDSGLAKKWNEPKFDDKKWLEIKVPAFWEDQGITTANSFWTKDTKNQPYSGYAWYRKHIKIPAAWSEKTIYLALGKIDDLDWVYWNGELVGHIDESTDFPDQVYRIYALPSIAVKPGKENLIAVRVCDILGLGGIHQGPILLRYEKKPEIPEENKYIGKTGTDRVNVGGSVHIQPGEVVKDAVAIGGNLNVEGTVTGDAVCVGGSLTISSSGEVYGDAVCVGGTMNIDSTAKLHGQQVAVGAIRGIDFGRFFQGKADHHRFFPFKYLFFITLFNIIYFCATVLAMVLVPNRIQLISDTIYQTPGKSFAVGIAAAILFIPLLIFLAITCIGIPLIPIAIIIAIIAWLLGYASVALMIGTRFFHLKSQTILWLALLGVLILVIVKYIPFLGWFLVLIFELTGFGAVILTKFGKPKKIVPGPQVSPVPSVPPTPPIAPTT
ncbi:MAG: sugar-binding domain-containing protein [bacterium]